MQAYSFTPARANPNWGLHYGQAHGTAPLGPSFQVRKGPGTTRGAQGKDSLLPFYSYSLPAPATRAAHILQRFCPSCILKRYLGAELLVLCTYC